MAGHVALSSGPKTLSMRSAFFSAISRRDRFARGLIVGDRGFIEVAHIVEFMIDAQMRPARSALRAGSSCPTVPLRSAMVRAV